MEALNVLKLRCDLRRIPTRPKHGLMFIAVDPRQVFTRAQARTGGGRATCSELPRRMRPHMPMRGRRSSVHLRSWS